MISIKRIGISSTPFGFKCIQLFLREGLVSGAMGSYEEKQLATSVASEPEVQEWIRNYVMERTSSVESPRQWCC